MGLTAHSILLSMQCEAESGCDVRHWAHVDFPKWGLAALNVVEDGPIWGGVRPPFFVFGWDWEESGW
jgi:hypothetical protein